MRHLLNVNPSDVTCLTLAPTGTAAFNLGGLKIYVGFMIPICASASKTSVVIL